MVTCDLGFVSADERSAAHDVFASDDEAIDAMGRGEDETGDQVLGSP